MKLRALLPICVTGAAAIGLFYAYGVAAPARRVRELSSALAERNNNIRLARNSIERTRELECECASIRTQLASRGDVLASPLVLFPEQMTRHFRQFGIENVTTRVNTGLKDPELPGYQRTFWSVAVPLSGSQNEVDRALLAFSDLESANPFLRVHTVTAFADSEVKVLGGRRAMVTVSVLTHQF